MATVQNFRELIVWQKAIALVKDVYHTVAQFPHMSDMAYRLK